MQATEEDKAAGEAYEALHVPALFSRWTPVLAELAGLEPGRKVLDVGCGTGVLARHVAAVLGNEAHVAGVDIDAGMLSVAERLGPGISWHQASAEALPFEDASFDAVVCQFGLMFFPDRPAALAEMLRVLTPGGMLTVAVWDALEHSELYRVVVDLLERRAGTRAADALRMPFALGDRAALEALFWDAGLEDPAVETRAERALFPSIRSLMEAELRGWLPVAGVQLDEALIESLLAETETLLSGFRTDDGALSFELAAHLVSCRKPDP